MSPVQRKKLLTIMRDHLAEGGQILLDVSSLTAFEKCIELGIFMRNFMYGFWASAYYMGLMRTFIYGEDNVALDMYTIFEQAKIRKIYNWMQYFSLESLKREIEGCELVVEEVFDDVAGTPYTGDSDEIAVIVRRR